MQKSLVNPWLASLVSFLPIIALLFCLFTCIPKQQPTLASIQPRWAGAGAFAGLTISANLLMSVLIDKFGWFGVEVHALSPGRMAGCALLVIGIVLISMF